MNIFLKNLTKEKQIMKEHETMELKTLNADPLQAF